MSTIFLALGILAAAGWILLGVYKPLKKYIEPKIKYKRVLKKIDNTVLVVTIGLTVMVGILGIRDLVHNYNKTKNEAMYRGILVSPKVISVPSNVTLPNVQIVISNNYPFPVYAPLVMIVKEGPIDLTTDFSLIPFFGGGLWKTRIYSCLLPVIPARSSLTCIATIDGSKYWRIRRILTP